MTYTPQPLSQDNRCGRPHPTVKQSLECGPPHRNLTHNSGHCTFTHGKEKIAVHRRSLADWKKHFPKLGDDWRPFATSIIGISMQPRENKNLAP